MNATVPLNVRSAGLRATIKQGIILPILAVRTAAQGLEQFALLSDL